MTSRRPAPCAIVSWNVDGLAPHLETSATHPLGSVWEGFGSPEIFCLQELRLRPEDTDLACAAARALPDCVCHVSLCRDRRNVTFRGGRAYGVASYVRQDLGTAVQHPVEWDREGRVVITELTAHGIAVVNVYAVNGTARPYYDHDLGRISGDRHTFKRTFQERLLGQCAELRRGGLELVLIGDWNVSLTAMDTYPRLRTEEPHVLARKHMNEVFLPALDVVDVFRALHPAARKYTWYNRLARGRRLDAARVDYALVSESLMGRVVSADVRDAPDARYRSDHAPLDVTLSL